MQIIGQYAVRSIAPASHMNLLRRLLQSFSEAKAVATHAICLPTHAASHDCPGPLVTRLTPAGSGGAGGTGMLGRPSCRRAGRVDGALCGSRKL